MSVREQPNCPMRGTSQELRGTPVHTVPSWAVAVP